MSVSPAKERLSPLSIYSTGSEESPREEGKSSSPTHPYQFRSLSILKSGESPSPSPKGAQSPRLPYQICYADVLPSDNNGINFLCLRLSFRSKQNAEEFYSKMRVHKEDAKVTDLKSDHQISKAFTVQIEFAFERMKTILRDLFRVYPPLGRYFNENWNQLTVAKKSNLN